MIGRFVISNIIYTLQMQGPSPLHLSSMDTVPSGIKPVRSYIGDFFLMTYDSKYRDRTLKQDLPCEMANPHRQKHSQCTPEHNSYDRPDRRCFTYNRGYITKDHK